MLPLNNLWYDARVASLIAATITVLSITFRMPAVQASDCGSAAVRALRGMALNRYVDSDYELSCSDTDDSAFPHPKRHFRDHLYANFPSDEPGVDRCSRLYILDLGSEFMDGKFMNIKEFLYFSMRNCLYDYIGRSFIITPLFHNESSRSCCTEQNCLELCYQLNEMEIVKPYNGDMLVWSEKQFVLDYIMTLFYYLKSLPPCPKNSVVLISNRLFNATVAEEIYEGDFYGLDIIIVGREELTTDALRDMYGSLTPNLFAATDFSCLSGQLSDCIAPCNNATYDECKTRDLTHCNEQSLPPSAPQKGDEYSDQFWHITYIFALSRNITEKQFKKIKNSIRIPLDDYYKAGNKLAIGLFLPDYKVAWLYDIGNVEKALNVGHDGNVFDADVIDEQSTVTTKLFVDAVNAYRDVYPHFETQPTRQPMPRINFTNDYLDVGATHSVAKFELRIYAFSSTAFEYYDGRHLVPRGEIFALNPSDPLLIAIDGGVSIYQMGNNPLTYYVAIGTFLMSILMLGICTVLYKQKLLWMKKIERFREIHHGQNNKATSDFAADTWELSWDKILIKNGMKLGNGAYGDVYGGILRGAPPILTKNSKKIISTTSFYGIEDREVAIKVLPQYASESAKREFLHEIEMMKIIGYNECIVNMLGCITSGAKLCLVLEYCHYRDLLHYVKTLKKELETITDHEDRMEFVKDFMIFFWQISDGMRYLASKGIVHRDLAARNILIDTDKNAKIADFGLCTMMTKGTPNSKSSRSSDSPNKASFKRGPSGRFPIKWLAIECLQHQEFSIKSDVWSFGMTIYETYSFGEVPFEGITPEDLIVHLENGNRPAQPELCPSDIYEIMKNCWHEKPEKRPCFQELLTLFTVQLERLTEGYGYLSLLRCTSDARSTGVSKLALAKSFRQENMERRRSRAASIDAKSAGLRPTSWHPLAELNQSASLQNEIE